MTLTVLKNVVSGLLTADNLLPDDENIVLGLLEMAFSDITTQADALHLMTMHRDGDIARLGRGKFIVRYPIMPVIGEDPGKELDIDNELCFPLARLIASYVSDKKSAQHFSEARRLVQAYNSKVYEMLESLKEIEVGKYDV